MSFSSGAISVKNNAKLSMVPFYTRLEKKVNILEGFTDFQASKFLRKIHSPFSFTDVKHITGNNPFLLSLTVMPNFDEYNSITANVASYKNVARDAAETWLSNNLKLLSPECSTLEQFFLLMEVQNCRKFTYFASREDSLTDDKIIEFQSTILCKHHLVSLVSVPLGTIEEDQDYNDQSLEELLKDSISAEALSQSHARVLKWNLPIMGEVLIDVLDKYVVKSTDEQLREMCRKVRSFAGFWYENLFFQHHQANATLKISYVSYAPKETAKTNEITIRIENQAPLNDVTLPLKENILYELRAGHPIVDALGLLKANDGNFWLVFIQVSLQHYADHRSLCDLFKRAPKHFPVQMNWSVYTYYKKI